MEAPHIAKSQRDRVECRCLSCVTQLLSCRYKDLSPFDEKERKGGANCSRQLTSLGEYKPSSSSESKPRTFVCFIQLLRISFRCKYSSTKSPHNFEVILCNTHTHTVILYF